ncbi:MAG TPA: nitrate/nitrite transporter NrtS [Stellaceae bacterium]|nr:nitrate/nitrite transporter NrtS [Stellaceae bacterium]
MDKVGRICHCAFSDGVARRSLVVAAIVGTILNLINQGDALVTGMPLDLMKLGLTYLVPYCVSTYGAVSYRLHATRLVARQAEPVVAR